MAVQLVVSMSLQSFVVLCWPWLAGVIVASCGCWVSLLSLTDTCFLSLACQSSIFFSRVLVRKDAMYIGAASTKSRHSLCSQFLLILPRSPYSTAVSYIMFQCGFVPS